MLALAHNGNMSNGIMFPVERNPATGKPLSGDYAKRRARTWYGPVPSGYGLHAVYTYHRTGAKLPDFNDLKERLSADWMSVKQRQLARKAYENIRERYRVLLEGMPYDMDMSG